MKRRYNWKIFLNVFCFMMLLFSTLSAQAEEATYTDEQGNEFVYKIGDDQTITITDITLSGDTLFIPETINDNPVIAVDNDSYCVVSNPEVYIPELMINCHTIGAYAFCNLNIGTLTIGEDVSVFTQSRFSEGIYYYWNQFTECKIEHLIYKAKEAYVVNNVLEVGTSSPCTFGPFYDAVIDNFTLGSDIKIIPNYLLLESNTYIQELDLHASEVGAMAFQGFDILIDKLILGKEVAFFYDVGNSNALRFWGQFARTTIGEVYYYATSLMLDREPETQKYYYEGPFYNSKIGKLYLSNEVERYPAYCFQNANLQQEELQIHAKSIGMRAFFGENISIGTLIIGEEVNNFEKIEIESLSYYEQFGKCSIDKLICQATKSETEIVDTEYGVFYETEITDVYTHHNSDFNKFFSNEDIVWNYLCADYFETTYGNKFYDEKTKKYLLEVFYICSSCGYEEDDIKVLDRSYQISFSYPAGIALKYSTFKRTYTGSGEVMIWGRLGDYYDGVHAITIKDESYGKAIMDENTYDISDFLTIELIRNDTLTYPGSDLEEDEFFLAWDLCVEVDALAFIESGAGTYTFYIPVGWELEY